jgi:hypothetical protein
MTARHAFPANCNGRVVNNVSNNLDLRKPIPRSFSGSHDQGTPIPLVFRYAGRFRRNSRKNVTRDMIQIKDALPIRDFSE